MYNKIKLITHNDLDGVGCAIILALTFEEMKFEMVSPSKVDEVLLDTINGEEEFDAIFITDLCFTPQVLDDVLRCSIPIIVIDHHTSNEWLNEYDKINKNHWFTVRSKDQGVKSCGTSLVYSFGSIVNWTNNKFNYGTYVMQMVETIRQWDTWDWVNIKDSKAKDLSTLLGIYSNEKFFDEFLNRCIESKNGPRIPEFSLSDTDILLLDLESGKKEKYISDKLETVDIIDINGHKVALCYAELYISELGTRIYNMLTTVDYVMIISGKTISFRSNKDHIDLSNIATKLGGGGHKGAAGCPIPENIKTNYHNAILRHVVNKLK